MVQTTDTILILHKEHSESVVDEVHNDRCHEERSHTRHHAVNGDNEDGLFGFVVHITWENLEISEYKCQILNF